MNDPATGTRDPIESITLPPIRHNAYIGVPPERVYETLTTGAGWDAWFTQGTEVDPRPGGRIVLRWVDFKVERHNVTSDGPVLEAEPPRRFVFQWRAGDSMTTVAFDLEPRGPGTIVRVEESGHTKSQRDVDSLVDCATGWGEALTLLKFHLEHGVVYGKVPEE
jgi:uncharacterized protein YndB with AHSA1/START domain